MVDREPDTGFFSEVYDKVFPVILRVVVRITGRLEIAEELSQEALVRYFQSDVPRTVEDAKYWLLRVSKNLALNYLKKKKREKKAYEKALQERPRASASSDIPLLESETRKDVQMALDRLPENLRLPLIMREYGGLNYRDISKILALSEGNVKVRVCRARERLAGILKAGAGGFDVP
jgi:RNA polymerase sigma-70 factor (ECF subfamily)